MIVVSSLGLIFKLIIEKDICEEQKIYWLTFIQMK
jgi:hypothetical protein